MLYTATYVHLFHYVLECWRDYYRILIFWPVQRCRIQARSVDAKAQLTPFARGVGFFGAGAGESQSRRKVSCARPSTVKYQRNTPLAVIRLQAC
jgi:hypothetical protein